MIGYTITSDASDVLANVLSAENHSSKQYTHINIYIHNINIYIKFI